MLRFFLKYFFEIFIKIFQVINTKKFKNINCFIFEIDSYIKETTKNVDPVEFWRLNKETYPGLFYCFEYIFSIMASSVPSESLFSEAGDQVTDKRNRLDPEKVNKMMVLESFYKFT